MGFDANALTAPAQNQQEAAAAQQTGRRAQYVQRLQVGLSGLVGMVLLVGLAHVILASAEQNRAEVVADAVVPSESPAPKPAAPSSVLAEAGVAPSISAPTPETAPAAPADPDAPQDPANPRP